MWFVTIYTAFYIARSCCIIPYFACLLEHNCFLRLWLYLREPLQFGGVFQSHCHWWAVPWEVQHVGPLALPHSYSGVSHLCAKDSHIADHHQVREHFLVPEECCGLINWVMLSFLHATSLLQICGWGAAIFGPWGAVCPVESPGINTRTHSLWSDIWLQLCVLAVWLWSWQLLGLQQQPDQPASLFHHHRGSGSQLCVHVPLLDILPPRHLCKEYGGNQRGHKRGEAHCPESSVWSCQQSRLWRRSRVKGGPDSDRIRYELCPHFISFCK